MFYKVVAYKDYRGNIIRCLASISQKSKQRKGILNTDITWLTLKDKLKEVNFK
ncbi:MAG: hypothetical protein K8S23_03675 [Candidatus Cloacimonetes bacterium]|nr:hypothetical protein [Candidatus Cloacimonadota bacterium]